jgi:hypothetical protein
MEEHYPELYFEHFLAMFHANQPAPDPALVGQVLAMGAGN